MTVILGRPQMSCQRGLASDRIGVDRSGWRRMLSLLLSHRSFVAQRILQETTLTPLGQTPPLRSKCPVVESVPDKVSGAWVLKGTRMPVSAIFENMGAGA